MPLLNELREKAQELGLCDLGGAVAGPSRGYDRYRAWLLEGNAAEMTYLERGAEARRHPQSVLPQVQSILVGVLSVKALVSENPSVLPVHASGGAILSYAVRRDYHLVLKEKLHVLRAFLAKKFPRERFRVCVDSAPLLEKEWAYRSGLGSYGRNTLLIHPKAGPAVFLGFLLTTLPPSELGMESEPGIEEKQDEGEHRPASGGTVSGGTVSDDLVPGAPCGQCRRCLDACPTGALRENRTLDARRCLNYWTIEHPGDDIPEVIRARLGGRLFGCDQCQRVCPRAGALPSPAHLPPRIVEAMTPEEFRTLFAHTPIERLGLERLQRNARWLR